MVRSLRLWLVMVALLTSALAFACGDGNGDGGGSAEEPTATAPAAGGDNTPATSEDTPVGDTDTGAFSDVPVPSGAEETDSGTFTGAIPFAVPSGDIDQDAFTTLEFKEYTLGGTPEEAVQFYRDGLDGWDEVYVFTGGASGSEGGFGVWTRDDGQTALWIGASDVAGETQLVVILGTQG